MTSRDRKEGVIPHVARDVEEFTPYAEREAALRFHADWLREEPSTLALIRWPISEGPSTVGLFKDLGITEVLAVERDGGARDGHDCWITGKGWHIHIRFAGLHFLFLHLQRRFDEANLRDVLTHGEVLFDKIAVLPPLKVTARQSLTHKILPARQAYRHRVELTDFTLQLDHLFAQLESVSPDGVAHLFDIYLKVMMIASRMSDSIERTIRRDTAMRMAVAGKGRAEFSAAVTLLRENVMHLRKNLGGGPRGVQYFPSSAILCIPPPMPAVGKPGEASPAEPNEAPEEERFLCTTCGRLFTKPEDAPCPVIAHEPAAAALASPAQPVEGQVAQAPVSADPNGEEDS